MLSPIDQSIRQLGPIRWQIGSLVCERTKTVPPTDVLATWKEHDRMYIIREDEDLGDDISPFVESSDEVQLVHQGGSLSAVWAIGRQAFCKVKAWNPAMESEDKTIAFVKKIAPQIPTPEVIYAWTEQDRSFLILKRIEGFTLRDAWTSLSPSRRHAIIKTIAHHCNDLAQNTSQLLGSDPTQLKNARYFSASSGECPKLGRVFHFYHPDLGPGNIIVSDGRVAGIIDWEAAGYYPRFWIATKPSVSPGLDFCPSIAGFDDFEWRKRLRIELETWGYPQASEWYIKWRTFQLK
ncbi:MAG: hypothetical protein Q9225_004321 [Loekoesia sp. 1 TL-2023]